jgi:hypothetical protein
MRIVDLDVEEPPQALSGILVIGGAVVLTHEMGLLGLGVTWVAAQVSIAATALPSLLDRRQRLRVA